MNAHPQRLGPYEVTGVLGSGGVGAVYVGRHPKLGYEVALKVLLVGGRASELQLKRFEREADALSKLRHPGLVDVVGRGRERGLPWLAMRRVPGQNLAERILERGRLSPSEAHEFGLQLAAALGAAHAVGVIHRDLKPENVLCTPEGGYVLTDFGLAKDLEVEHSVELSKTGVSQGTPGFWAPEQALGGETSAATDVYGWGATVYAALTGAPPIEAESFLEAVVATKDTPPKSFAHHGVSAPALEGLVRRCLAKEPAQRFQDLASLTDALEESARGRGARGDTRSRRWLPLAAGLACALLLALGALAARLSPTAPADSAPGADTIQPSAPEAPSPPAASPPPSALPPAIANVAALTPTELAALARTYLAEGRWQEAAERFGDAWSAGDVASALPLAELYMRGRGVAIDRDRGRSLLRQAAERGHPGAMLALGKALSARKPQEARSWLARALRGGERSEALLALADLIRREGRSPEARAEALGLYREAAQAGAQREGAFGAARIQLLSGEREDGLRTLHSLAAGGYWPAAAELGPRLAASRDPSTVTTGQSFLEQGAAAGDLPCARELGLLLLRGRAEERPTARRWLQAAAEGGDAEAMLAFVSASSLPEEEARAWIERAAALELPRAEVVMGRLALRAKDYSEAQRWFERAAEARFGEALAILAEFYEQGIGVAPDLQRADLYLEQAAAAGNASAQHNLAVQFERGQRRERDLKQAETLYKLAGSEGLGIAAHSAARLLDARGEPAEALVWYREGARLGHGMSMLTLANHLVAGDGVERDLEQGLSWFKRAAQAGVPSGYHMAAMMIERGLGSTQDFVAAADLYRQAAEAGDLASMLALAEFLTEGKGLTVDLPQAESWLKRACEESTPQGEALYERGYSYARGSGLPRDPVRAVALYERAAAAGHPEAAFELALHLSRGRGVAEDLPRAAALFGQQAEVGRPSAMLELARLLARGQGLVRDVPAARRWIREAVDKDPQLAATAEALLTELVAELEEELKREHEHKAELERKAKDLRKREPANPTPSPVDTGERRR